MTVAPGQMAFDLDTAMRRLADDLRREGAPAGGAERLLRAMVRGGLDQRALRAAAALALELDQPRNREPVA